MDGPAAGWYMDPSSSHHLRWWDGYQWTEHTQPAAPAPPPPSWSPPASTTPPPAPTAGHAATPTAEPTAGSTVEATTGHTAIAAPTRPAAWTAGTSGPTRASSRDGGDDRGDMLAVVSLVSGVLWLLWIGSLTAIVTGILALRKKVTGGHQAMAIAGIVLGVVSLPAAPLLAAIALPVFFDQREAAVEGAVESDARHGAVEMETAFTQTRGYPAGSNTPLDEVLPGFAPRGEVEVILVSSDERSYCLKATHPSGAVAWYDSTAGGLTDIPCG